jgi:hypothetical protein
MIGRVAAQNSSNALHVDRFLGHSSIIVFVDATDIIAI